MQFNNLNLNDFFSIDSISPFLKKYTGSIVVIKYGGAAMKNEFLQSNVIQNICYLHSLGLKVVLVHGGGPFINNWLNKLDIVPKFEKGIRITDRDTMDIVEMVLAGKINKKLVSLFNQYNISSIGLSGKDANLLIASPLFIDSNNLVGKIDIVNNHILQLLLDHNYIPVISSIATSVNNETYNVNADNVASAIALSLKAESLILLTDTLGVMKDIHNPSTLIKNLNLFTINKLKNQSIISGGMIPKVDCCINALKGGVNSAHIISGNLENAILYELLTSNRIGSRITME